MYYIHIYIYTVHKYPRSCNPQWFYWYLLCVATFSVVVSASGTIRHLGSWQKFHEHDAFAERAAQLRPAESPVATGPHASWLDEWLLVMPKT